MPVRLRLSDGAVAPGEAQSPAETGAETETGRTGREAPSVGAGAAATEARTLAETEPVP